MQSKTELNGIRKSNEGGISVYKVYFRGVFLTERGSREDAESVLAHYCRKIKSREEFKVG